MKVKFKRKCNRISEQVMSQRNQSILFSLMKQTRLIGEESNTIFSFSLKNIINLRWDRQSRNIEHENSCFLDATGMLRTHHINWEQQFLLIRTSVPLVLRVSFYHLLGWWFCTWYESYFSHRMQDWSHLASSNESREFRLIGTLLLPSAWRSLGSS